MYNWLGLEKVYISCPDDLFHEIVDYYENKGFKVRREKYEITDFDGWGTGEYGYNYYISI